MTYEAPKSQVGVQQDLVEGNKWKMSKQEIVNTLKHVSGKTSISFELSENSSFVDGLSKELFKNPWGKLNEQQKKLITNIDLAVRKSGFSTPQTYAGETFTINFANGLEFKFAPSDDKEHTVELLSGDKGDFEASRANREILQSETIIDIAKNTNSVVAVMRAIGIKSPNIERRRAFLKEHPECVAFINSKADKKIGDIDKTYTGTEKQNLAFVDWLVENHKELVNVVDSGQSTVDSGDVLDDRSQITEGDDAVTEPTEPATPTPVVDTVVTSGPAVAPVLEPTRPIDAPEPVLVPTRPDVMRDQVARDAEAADDAITEETTDLLEGTVEYTNQQVSDALITSLENMGYTIVDAGSQSAHGDNPELIVTSTVSNDFSCLIEINSPEGKSPEIKLPTLHISMISEDDAYRLHLHWGANADVYKENIDSLLTYIQSDNFLKGALGLTDYTENGDIDEPTLLEDLAEEIQLTPSEQFEKSIHEKYGHYLRLSGVNLISHLRSRSSDIAEVAQKESILKATLLDTNPALPFTRTIKFELGQNANYPESKSFEIQLHSSPSDPEAIQVKYNGQVYENGPAGWGALESAVKDAILDAREPEPAVDDNPSDIYEPLVPGADITGGITPADLDSYEPAPSEPETASNAIDVVERNSLFNEVSLECSKILNEKLKAGGHTIEGYKVKTSVEWESKTNAMRILRPDGTEHFSAEISVKPDGSYAFESSTGFSTTDLDEAYEHLRNLEITEEPSPDSNPELPQNTPRRGFPSSYDDLNSADLQLIKDNWEEYIVPRLAPGADTSPPTEQEIDDFFAKNSNMPMDISSIHNLDAMSEARGTGSNSSDTQPSREPIPNDLDAPVDISRADERRAAREAKKFKRQLEENSTTPPADALDGVHTEVFSETPTTNVKFEEALVENFDVYMENTSRLTTLLKARKVLQDPDRVLSINTFRTPNFPTARVVELEIGPYTGSSVRVAVSLKSNESTPDDIFVEYDGEQYTGSRAFEEAFEKALQDARTPDDTGDAGSDIFEPYDGYRRLDVDEEDEKTDGVADAF